MDVEEVDTKTDLMTRIEFSLNEGEDRWIARNHETGVAAWADNRRSVLPKVDKAAKRVESFNRANPIQEDLGPMASWAAENVRGVVPLDTETVKFATVVNSVSELQADSEISGFAVEERALVGLMVRCKTCGGSTKRNGRRDNEVLRGPYDITRRNYLCAECGRQQTLPLQRGYKRFLEEEFLEQ